MGAEIEIDVDAVEAARQAMISIMERVSAQRNQHQQASGDLESMLSNAASAVLDTLNPLHLLDGSNIWDRWGFGTIARSCSASHGFLGEIHQSVDQIINRLVRAHPGPLEPILEESADSMRAAIASARERFSSMANVLHPGNVLYLIEHPYSIIELCQEGLRCLERTLSCVRDHIEFLRRLAARERQLIEDIVRQLLAEGAKLTYEGREIVLSVKGIWEKIKNVRLPDLSEGKELGKAFERKLILVGFIADIVEQLAEGKLNWRTLSVDANAALATLGIEYIPYVDVVFDAFALVGIGAEAAGWGIKELANNYEGESRDQLIELAEEVSHQGEMVNPYDFTHDLGAFASDAEGSLWELVSGNHSDIGDYHDMLHDLGDTGKDLGNMVWGTLTLNAVEFDGVSIGIDVYAREHNAPAWIQTPLDDAAYVTHSLVNGLANLLPWG